jgi:uncharacterized protein (TIGR03435 family)
MGIWKWLIPLLALGTAEIMIGATNEFEVASVRPNMLNDRIVSIAVGPGGRFVARGYTLVLLIQRAYGVMDWNVEGGPGWIRSDRFDVAATAKVAGNLTEVQLRPMLQDLLAKRFRLRTHMSEKRMPGYALVVAAGGLKATPSAEGEEHPDTGRMNNKGLKWEGLSMANFARFVGGKLNLVPALDETGLKGLYDFRADWKLEANPFSDEDARYAVLSALRDQLGLKLFPKRVTVQMIVIDGAEKATASQN